MHKTLRRLPSLDFLRGFEASGRLKSFTRAADELHLTQSALSRQVAAIEEALGVALFERSTGRLHSPRKVRHSIARSRRICKRSHARPRWGTCRLPRLTGRRRYRSGA
jgi:DNA-binding transcriptional LysR family regulator